MVRLVCITLAAVALIVGLAASARADTFIYRYTPGIVPAVVIVPEIPDEETEEPGAPEEPTRDLAPDPFSFINATDVSKTSSWRMSNVVRLTGHDGVPVSISSTGTTRVRICKIADCSDGAWAMSGVADEGDYLQLRTNTAGAGVQTYTATVTAGETSASWSITTALDEQANYGGNFPQSFAPAQSRVISSVLALTHFDRLSLSGVGASFRTCQSLHPDCYGASSWMGARSVEMATDGIDGFVYVQIQTKSGDAGTAETVSLQYAGGPSTWRVTAQ